MLEILNLIINEVKKFKHEIIFDYILSRVNIDELKCRYFKVFVNNNRTKVTWYNPEILDCDIDSNYELDYMITAKIAYLYTTNGKDLRHITKEVLKRRLYNNGIIYEFYNTPNKTIISLYYDVIKEFILNEQILYINCGVISLKQLYNYSFILNNIDGLNNVNDTIIIEPNNDDNEITVNDILSLISNDDDNMITIGSDGLLISKSNIYLEDNW